MRWLDVKSCPNDSDLARMPSIILALKEISLSIPERPQLCLLPSSLSLPEAVSEFRSRNADILDEHFPASHHKLTLSATSSVGVSARGAEPLYHVIQAAGLAPRVLQVSPTTVPSSTGPLSPMISVDSGRTATGTYLFANHSKLIHYFQVFCTKPSPYPISRIDLNIRRETPPE